MNEETQLTKPQTFEQKLMDRIRDSIGELMTDEDLKRIVEKGVHKAIFEGREGESDRWGSKKIEPPLIDVAVKQHLEGQMSKAITNWITEHPEEMQKAVDDALKCGIAGCLSHAFESKFQWMFNNMQNQINSMTGRIP